MKHFHHLAQEINLFLSSSQSQALMFPAPQTSLSPDFSRRSSSFLLRFLSQAGANGDNAAMSVEEVAMGFIRVANEAMCRPIRALTQVS